MISESIETPVALGQNVGVQVVQAGPKLNRVKLFQLYIEVTQRDEHRSENSCVMMLKFTFEPRKAHVLRALGIELETRPDAGEWKARQGIERLRELVDLVKDDIKWDEKIIVAGTEVGRVRASHDHVFELQPPPAAVQRHSASGTDKAGSPGDVLRP